MKKQLFLVAFVATFASIESFAQTNTFPTTGNVGIGTTSPSSLLTLAGNNNITFTGVSTQNQPMTVGTDGGDNGYINFGGGFGKFFSIKTNGSTVAQFGAAGNGHVINGYTTFNVNSSNTSLIVSQSGAGSAATFTGGNVGIGTTSPSSLLDVNGSSIFRNSLTLNFGTTNRTAQLRDNGLYISRLSDGNYASTITADGSITYDTRNNHYFKSDGTSILTMLNGGNIGIGTTSPSAKLQVNGNFSIINPTYTGSLSIQHTANGAMAFINSAIGTFMFVGPTNMVDFGGQQIRSVQRGAFFSNTLVGYALQTAEGNNVFNTTSGNTGIGTTAPIEKLDVNGNIKSTGFILPTNAAAGKVLTSDASGNATWQAAASAGWGFDGNAVGVLKKIGTADNYALPFITNNTEQMRITTAGNVGIGTASPSEKLSVNGNILSKKVRVTQTGWADYVFHSSYELPSLSEVEAYIKKHQHLKDIPSAAEVERDGLDLGSNQAALLKKIEELTLYVIEQQKEIEELKVACQHLSSLQVGKTMQRAK